MSPKFSKSVLATSRWRSKITSSSTRGIENESDVAAVHHARCDDIGTPLKSEFVENFVEIGFDLRDTWAKVSTDLFVRKPTSVMKAAHSKAVVCLELP